MGSMTAEPGISFPPKVYAEAVVRSASGESLLRSKQAITRHTVDQFHATDGDLQRAATDLQRAGFEVLDIGRTSVNIAAPAEVYGAVLKARLETVERPTTRDLSQPGVAEFINSQDQSSFGEIDLSNTGWEDLLDGVAINAPAYYLQGPIPKATPPLTSKPYLQVPTDLAMELRATLAHGQGITGKGVKVAVVDSGCYTQHPFFQHHSYHLQAVLGPGAANPEEDENGHGTGVVANLLAIAPEVDLTLVKADVALASKSRNINSTAAFRAAVALKPDIISCSWGSDLRSPYYLSSFHRVLASAIADAVNQGILVVCAAGNGQWGFPSQHPDVIAVGGVFKHLEGSLKGRLEASNYASSFISAIYPDRRVPDVCGLVGQLPSAAYIMLPVSPGSEIDQLRALTGDETETTDGWAAFSGTSSAAPQVAGGCALLRQAAPGLGPFELRQVLEETARDIGEGCSNAGTGGAQARDGPDLATGYGLVDIERAVRAVRATKNLLVGNIWPQFSFSNSTPRNNQEINHQFKRNKNFIHSNLENKGTKSMEEKTLRILRNRINEIEIDINDFFREKYTEFANENIRISIGEENFIESTFSSQAEEFLVNGLKEILDENGNVDSNKIRIEHISNAASLLNKQKFLYLATKVLFEAIKLKGRGKEIRYFVDTHEISAKDVLKLDIQKLEINLLIKGFKEPHIEIFSKEKKKLKLDDIEGSCLQEEIIDREEIASFSAKVLDREYLNELVKPANTAFFDSSDYVVIVDEERYYDPERIEEDRCEVKFRLRNGKRCKCDKSKYEKEGPKTVFTDCNFY